MASTSFEKERKAIESRFQSNWNEVTYPVKWEGIPFESPGAAPWVALVILPGQGLRKELGAAGLARYPGTIIVQIFIPPNDPTLGSRKAAQMGDLVKDVFNEAEFTTESAGQIWCRTTSLIKVGVQAGWLQYNAQTPYERDEA